MSSKEISAFIALWDKKIGAKIVDQYPKSTTMDLELITTQIFLAFQSFYASEEEQRKIKRTLFKLPLKNLNLKASIFIDQFKNEGDKENGLPFILVLLIPDYISDEDLNKFDNIISNIGKRFLELKQPLLEDSFDEANELFLLTEQLQDTEIVIDNNYSINDALLDFKKGLELFSKRMYEQSYFSIKKAHIKFKSESRVNLTLETTFFLGSILSHLNKFKPAINYFSQLEELSRQLKHQKYFETSIFMQAFSCFKYHDYREALNNFEKLESHEIQFIDKFNYHFIYGRVLRLLNLNSKAVSFLLKALELSDKMEESDDIKEKRAKLLLEIGHTNYAIAKRMVSSGKIEEKDFKKYLLITINYYNNAIEFWSQINNFSSLIQTYHLIGNIYDLLDDIEKSIKNYRQALKFTEISNDILNRLNIFNLIIIDLAKLDMHEQIVQEIDIMLSQIVPFAFIDLHTISGLHRQLGESLFKLGRGKEALSELLISLNIYNKFDSPTSEALLTLNTIIEIYKSSEDQKYTQYYEEQYNKLNEKIQELVVSNKKKTFNVMIGIKEIWIFDIKGIELFSYAPYTEVDPLLFGGFLSALQNFSKELTSKFLDSITMGLDQYIFFRKEDFPIFILGRTSIKGSLNNIEKNLKILYEEFWNQYQSVLQDFDGEVTRFREFNKIFENINVKYSQ